MPLGAQFEGVLAAAKTGAEWAIAALYREQQPNLLRYLRSQAAEEGDDLAADVWLDAGAALNRFEGDEDDFRRWLFTIARRRLIDFRRRAARRKALLDLPESRPEPHSHPDPEAHALAAWETEESLALIASLPPEQAEVVLLRVVAGLPADDVAAIMGKTPGAVRVLQHRALKRLADRLASPSREGVTR